MLLVERRSRLNWNGVCVVALASLVVSRKRLSEQLDVSMDTSHLALVGASFYLGAGIGTVNGIGLVRVLSARGCGELIIATCGTVKHPMVENQY